MGLVQVATETVTSAVSTLDLIGTTTNDVYMITITGYIPDTDVNDLRARVLESSSANSTSNYDRAMKVLRADTTFQNLANTNETYYDLTTSVGNNTGEQMNGILYLYNANNSSEYTFLTMENVQLSATALLIGNQGGAVFTSASAVNGLQFFAGGGDIGSGTFTLYRVV